jgi:hypothetical protein
MRITLNELKKIVKETLNEEMYGGVDTNESLEALLDSTIANGTFDKERLSSILKAIAQYYTMQQSVADFSNVSGHIESLANRIPNSLPSKQKQKTY